ncbi:MAG: PAS domain-containing sensor histidine kinase [Myxococcales bacterium]
MIADPLEGVGEARFRLLVESVKDYAIFLLDPRGNVRSWNVGAEKIKGYRADEIIGKHFSTFYPAEDVASGKCERELEIATDEGRFEEEGWRIRKDGSRMWANVTITALRNGEGSVIGFAKVTRDLTERRRAEEDARRFRLLVESVRDYAIFMLDPGGYVMTWNLGAERIKGYRADEIIGKHFSTFYPPEVAASGKCAYELEVAVNEGRFEEEGWRIRKDGSRMWANVTITALRDPEGAVLGFAKVTRDLTERRQAEENERALAAERAAVAEKGRIQEFQERFLGILGHDLRNPLAAIDMGAAILHQQIADPRMLRVIARMQSSSLRMSRMIEQILDLTRSRLADGLQLRLETTDLCATITGIVEELRTAYPGQEIDVQCPPVTGSWDRDRLEQVFSNLIGNAVIYGDATRSVTVVVRQEDRLVVADVHNDGEPIPEELQPVLFNPFRRGERDSRTAKTAGLGLGLYISNEIVRAHGGGLALRSNQTEGTTFRVTLPFERSAPRREVKP